MANAYCMRNSADKTQLFLDRLPRVCTEKWRKVLCRMYILLKATAQTSDIFLFFLFSYKRKSTVNISEVWSIRLAIINIKGHSNLMNIQKLTVDIN